MDTRAATRIVDELLWSLRRAGFTIATSQAIDAARAVAAVGWGDREAVREALASVIVHERRRRGRFDAAFDAFFGRGSARGSAWDRLAALGFTEAELAHARALLSELEGAEGVRFAPLVERGAELDRLLLGAELARLTSALQVGFYTQRALQRAGVPAATRALAALRTSLVGAFGERGERLAEALREEAEAGATLVRAHVRDVLARREADANERQGAAHPMAKPLAALSPEEAAEVRRAVRAFVERLRGGQRVRARRARAGRLDPHRTLRKALRTGGVPFAPVRRDARRDKARLVLLCDVSDSVRTVARFTLELAHAAQELFDRTRTFVFVSELGETTALFRDQPLDAALGVAYGGGAVSIAADSNYGRVLRAFEARHLKELDRRTTVVLLGDGRTNYHDDGAEVLDRIRDRARALVWLCPEGPGEWALGDSAMPRYAPKCTSVLEVRCARDLERAARLILAR